MEDVKLEDVVTVPGYRPSWVILELGCTSGQRLSDGYQEDSWYWARLGHHDAIDKATWPGFETTVSVSTLSRNTEES